MLVICAATAIASPAQTLTALYSFCSQSGCTDGARPFFAGVIQASDGNFYGTTLLGGAYNGGTVFKITPNGTLTTLYSFCPHGHPCTDGTEPYAGLVQATDGNFYGTTYSGGATGNGTVFKITSSGTLTTLYSFCSQPSCTDGYNPFAGLVQASDGNFYGTTYQGGAQGFGTVFKITAAGTLTTLHSFSVTDGTLTNAGLIQASDGNFYGTTLGGGAHGEGTVFKISSQSPYTLTALYSFCSQTNCADGSSSEAALVQASDGNFYGTTVGGGANNDGTAFKITSTGTLTTLHSFCSQKNCADGAAPYAGLVQATDGDLYGTTGSGGAASSGTVFKVTPAGALTTLYSFCSQKNCADGAAPYAGLMQATDGNLYGTTYQGGANGSGMVFRLIPRLQLASVTPCRLVDTRPQYGGKGPIQGGTYQTFNLPQLAQENPNCANISSAATYSLNVTVVPQGFLGYLTIWPASQPQPTISTLNSYDGRIKAVAAIVPGGASAAVSVFVSDTTNVILDIDGYFTGPSQQTLQFYPLPPCRVADTRFATGFGSGLGAPYLMGNQERDFPILNASMNQTPCNIPNTAQAYSMNFTAVPHGFLGYLTLWPTGQSQPVVSTLNSYGGQVTANAAIVPAGTNGEISTFVTNDTDLLIDINGYFAPPGVGGLSLYPVLPCRVIDTRTAYGGKGPFKGTLNPPVDPVNSPCVVPATSQADVFNATVVPTGELGFLTLWPDGIQQPVVSTLNAYDGIVTSNMAIVPTGTQGMINAYAEINTAPTDLILDISSYFAP